MCDKSMLKACFCSWKAYASCLTCFNANRQSFQLSDADLNFGFRIFVVQLCVLFKFYFCCAVF